MLYGGGDEPVACVSFAYRLQLETKQVRVDNPIGKAIGKQNGGVYPYTAVQGRDTRM